MAKPRSKFKKVKWLSGKEIKIPEEWVNKKLDEIGKIIGGGTPDSTKKEYWSGNILWATPTDITKLQTNRIENTERKITKQGLDNSSAKLLPKGTILITSRATIGECAIATQPIATNQGFQNIICNNKDFDNMYVFYLIRYHKSKLLRLAYGTTFLEINKSEIKKVTISTPVLLFEQQKIASILSGVDALIESTQEVIAKTERLKKGLMQKLLTKGIDHTKFKKVKWLLGKEIEVPEEWKLERLGNVCKIRKSSSISSDLYIGLEHIGQGNNLIESTGNVNEFTSTKNTFSQGDVLYGKLRPLLNKVWLATESGYCSTDILPLVPTNKILSQILLFVLTNHDFLWYAVGTSAGTKMPRTSWSDMKKFPVVLSNIQEQQKIASILSSADAYIQKNQEYKKKIGLLKKGLMQKLLTGQIRVKVDH